MSSDSSYSDSSDSSDSSDYENGHSYHENDSKKKTKVKNKIKDKDQKNKNEDKHDHHQYYHHKEKNNLNNCNKRPIDNKEENNLRKKQKKEESKDFNKEKISSNEKLPPKVDIKEHEKNKRKMNYKNIPVKNAINSNEKIHPKKTTDHFKINSLLNSKNLKKNSSIPIMQQKLDCINNSYDYDIINNQNNKLNDNAKFNNDNNYNNKKEQSPIELSFESTIIDIKSENDYTKIKIKYNTKTRKNSKNDNNKILSTSYNFVKFDNVSISKYSYQYHFLYKYRCNKRCESITWGGFKDCDEYKQYKLYIDNSDYSLSVLTTDLYSINNPALIRQMAFDEVVNYKNINYIGDVEYNRSMNHNLIYSHHSNVLLSNINNQQYYIWNLKNNQYPSYNQNDNNSIIDLKEPSLK